MKKKKKEIIGMGDPTKNMELFNQALGTGNITGTLSEELDTDQFYVDIIKQKICKVLDNLGFRNLYDSESNKDQLNIFIHMFITIKYNTNSNEWATFGLFGGDAEVEGVGINNLIDELILGYNVDQVKLKARDYYLKKYFAKSDGAMGEFETDSQDELIDWCQNIFEDDLCDKIKIINTGNLKTTNLYRQEFI